MGGQNRTEEDLWEIVVTGGEDTSLTVLAIHPNSSRIKVLSVITDHISSIRTLAARTQTREGSVSTAQSLSTLLVSAGGRAQMQCYRLLTSWDGQRQTPSCQVIQVASHRLDEQWERRRNRHKTVKMDPETRYMSVVVVEDRTDCVLLAVACSDGAIRLFSVGEVKRQIELLWETFYHQRCVLSVATCSLDDEKGNRYRLLVSAATDGKIAVWDFSELSLLSINTLSKTLSIPAAPCLVIPAHQSGINSLAVWKEKLEQHECRCLVTVASGGDDGHLTVSMIRVQYPGERRTGSSRGFNQISEPVVSQQIEITSLNQLDLDLQSQLHIPLAHAAPLTDLKLLRSGLLVSTSSDQRVCLWKVSSTAISHSGAVCSHVADASGLSVWEGEIIEEEEDKKRKIRSESEEEISILRQRERRTGLNMMSETGGRLNMDKETADRAKRGEPVEVMREAGDPVCTTSGERTCEKDDECINETKADSAGKTEREVKSETSYKAPRESEKKTEKMGWVLVCGQGFQLIRVRNRGIDADMWTSGGDMEKIIEKVEETLGEKST